MSSPPFPPSPPLFLLPLSPLDCGRVGLDMNFWSWRRPLFRSEGSPFAAGTHRRGSRVFCPCRPPAGEYTRKWNEIEKVKFEWCLLLLLFFIYFKVAHHQTRCYWNTLFSLGQSSLFLHRPSSCFEASFYSTVGQLFPTHHAWCGWRHRSLVIVHPIKDIMYNI